MSDRVFVDTNVLVYAHDLDAGRRHDIAARLVSELWETRTAVISTQVLEQVEGRQGASAEPLRGPVRPSGLWEDVTRIVHPATTPSARHSGVGGTSTIRGLFTR